MDTNLKRTIQSEYKKRQTRKYYGVSLSHFSWRK